MQALPLLEWVGAVSGLVGAALLAANGRYSGYGFVFFLGSNAAWFFYGTLTGTWGMVWMQLGFTLTSIVGIWRWFFRRGGASAMATPNVTGRANPKYLGARTS